jgi:hypothetical protein
MTFRGLAISLRFFLGSTLCRSSLQASSRYSRLLPATGPVCVSAQAERLAPRPLLCE